jgi:preprotein translocase subunit SecF
MEFFHKVTRIRFMASRKFCYAISAALIVAAIVALIHPGLNYGIDFTGGVAVEVNFPTAADLEKSRHALSTAGFPEAQTQNFGTSRDVVIRLEPHAGMSGNVIGSRIIEALKTVDPGVELRRVDVVGPQVGEELRQKGYLAMLFTFIFIMAYLWFRFEFKLSCGAILAALHTPIIILGFFAVTRMTFDLTVLAAVLAVVGYQINDTVVVFDRARERFPLMRGAPPAEVLDAAINQTLSRTVITHGATSIVVTTLLVLGGETLRGFATAFLVGIIVGTYSSIYIASASALDLGLSALDLLATRKNKGPVDDLP